MDLSYTELDKSITSGNIGGVYVFYGEALPRIRAVERIKARLLPEGFEALNLNVFDGQVKAGPVIEAAETLPLMAEKRIVLLRGSPMLKIKDQDKSSADKDNSSSDADEGDNSAISNEANSLSQWITNVPPTCCLIITAEEKPSTTRKLAKALESVAYYVNFSSVSETDKKKWCISTAKKLGHTFADNAYDVFRQASGGGMTHMNSELEKLCAYIGQREVITVEDIDQIVTPSVEYGVFKMIDALMSGQTAAAHTQLEAMLRRGEKTYGIIALLCRQLRLMTAIRLMRADGLSKSEICKRLGNSNNPLNDFVYNEAARQASHYTPEALIAGYTACVNADYHNKQGQNEALDHLMLTLSRMARVK